MKKVIVMILNSVFLFNQAAMAMVPHSNDQFRNVGATKIHRNSQGGLNGDMGAFEKQLVDLVYGTTTRSSNQVSDLAPQVNSLLASHGVPCDLSQGKSRLFSCLHKAGIISANQIHEMNILVGSINKADLMAADGTPLNPSLASDLKIMLNVYGSTASLGLLSIPLILIAIIIIGQLADNTSGWKPIEEPSTVCTECGGSTELDDLYDAIERAKHSLDYH